MNNQCKGGLFHPFYEELIYLLNNREFQKAICELRGFWGMKCNEYEKEPEFDVGTYWGHIIINNAEKINDVRSIVSRCRHGEGPYKILLIEAIMSYALYGYPTAYIAKALFMGKKKLEPVSEVKIEEIDKRITVKMVFPISTNKKEAYQEFMKNWEVIEKYKKKYKPERITPARNFERDYFKIFLPHIKGLSLQKIQKSLSGEIEPNSISTANIRIKKNIQEAFK